MVTVILLALSTSVDSVISVSFISDDTFAACPTITNNAMFIGAILAGASTCYRKEESEGTGEEGRGGGGEEGGGERAGEEGAYDAISQPYMCQRKHTRVPDKSLVESHVMKPHTHKHTQYPTLCVMEVKWRAALRSGVHFLL